jgi:hypothetical protein
MPQSRRDWIVRQGFVNYSKVWWHFSLREAAPAYDFPIGAQLVYRACIVSIAASRISNTAGRNAP